MNSPEWSAEADVAPSGRARLRLLVLGFGNALRGDDAAGPVAAGALAALDLPGVSVEARHQLTPELAELMAGFDHVVFIDAEPAPDGASPEPARIQELGPLEPGISRTSIFGHHQDPAALLALAGRLFGRAPRAWLVTIVAYSFELGATPSLPCSRGIVQAVQLVETLVENLAQGGSGAPVAPSRLPERLFRPPARS